MAPGRAPQLRASRAGGAPGGAHDALRDILLDGPITTRYRQRFAT
ncbi:hypothetical protein BURCENK562V_C6457 [Burkholderia cenocepacia K56-2Valvano]|nr:hypothetical protein BURCENK562V_C6457 [Burkholderia cenocepacia K56-2Valvano]